ncbi:hypothetical protein predicted by Glimmer/Critica [Streptococcus dysgalactiae subsp. equisimilis AC-2713]|uniref:Uncharacterized protein n=1 Tax=Streptococcus dysgalactiae subsp. equisimilis AC-2713 TaxID=759913 RepID=A0AB33R5G0_STREQ|nr:hypothetical protein predicted by Glimmer/Critica [Streptococcus dysgalactiae subsp. equisimilis AC-2713]
MVFFDDRHFFQLGHLLPQLDSLTAGFRSSRSILVSSGHSQTNGLLSNGKKESLML